jgi:hypothetical protein
LADALLFAVFGGAFITAVFLADGFGFAVAAFFAAHRFFKTATMAALRAALSFRFAFGGVGVAGADGSDLPESLPIEAVELPSFAVERQRRIFCVYESALPAWRQARSRTAWL